MDEEAEKLAGGPDPAPTRSNRGWFRPGDRRINRDGRPKKAADSDGTHPADRAAVADQVMRLSLPAAELAHRLTQPNGFWLVNLPQDYQIVGSRVDEATGRITFVIRSRQFPRIARGSPIPEFAPAFNGLKWRRNMDWRP
jgi:hypothetical protein